MKTVTVGQLSKGMVYMRIFIIRHGDPYYPTDSLTEKGERAKYRRGIVIYSTLILAFVTGVAIVAALVHYI